MDGYALYLYSVFAHTQLLMGSKVNKMSRSLEYAYTLGYQFCQEH